MAVAAMPRTGVKEDAKPPKKPPKSDEEIKLEITFPVLGSTLC